MGIFPAGKRLAQQHSGRRRLLVWLLFLTGPSLLFRPGSLYSLDYDQVTVERKLENNRKFIRYLDLCVTNMRKAEPGTAYDDLQKSIEKDFNEMLQKDYDANLHFLRREYPQSVGALVESRQIMQKLYREVLENYLEETDILLQAATPPILKTKDAHARHFLEMGFRNYNLARASHTRGYNVHVYLLGNQIRYYQEGIKEARVARRYAILAHIYARLPFEEKPENQLVSLDDLRRESSDEAIAEDNFQKTLFLLGSLIARHVLEENLQWTQEGQSITLNLVQVHEDDYGMLIPGRLSLWQRLADRLEAASFIPGAQSPSPSGNDPGATRGPGGTNTPGGPEKGPGPGSAQAPSSGATAAPASGPAAPAATGARATPP